MLNIISIVSLVISLSALVIGIITLKVAFSLQNKANKLYTDIGELIIQAITKNPDMSIFKDKNGKVYRGIPLTVKLHNRHLVLAIKDKEYIKATDIKKENN